MKLIQVSENRIVDAESGTVWSFDPGDVDEQAPDLPGYPKLYFDNRTLLANDEAVVMWGWLLRNLAV